MTQEEFEKIVNEVCKVATNDSPEKAAYLWNDCREGFIDVRADIVWTQTIFMPFDSNLKEVTKVLPTLIANSLYWFCQDEETRCEELPNLITENTNINQALVFATSDLDRIQDVVLVDGKVMNEPFSNQRIKPWSCASLWFLLFNPRREVVEWALETFNYKDRDLALPCWLKIEEWQTNYQLKELILNTLEKEGV
ncbi:MAG: hypothetical protein J6Y85_04305 [Alphaproteobacteria bacterium]|nr:hypothetical protein [Alphaproteobacteria bacterium]